MNENKIEVIDKTGALKIYLDRRPDGKFGIIMTRGVDETFEAVEFDDFFNTETEAQKKIKEIMFNLEKNLNGKFVQEDDRIYS